MARAITETVRFNVRVSSYHNEDASGWMAQAVETGLVTYGATREDAENLNGAANVLLVKRWKANGRTVLEGFMRKHGIKYFIEEQPGTETGESLPFAA